MADILKGAPVVEGLRNRMREQVSELAGNDMVPTLAVVRVGERPDDLAYEKNIIRQADAVGVRLEFVVLPENSSSEDLVTKLKQLDEDSDVHGILLFRPLPKHFDDEAARLAISPAKDVDGCTDRSLGAVFTNKNEGFPPCTAQAVVEILSHYGIEVAGKKVAIIGRSLVVGKPLAMMLMKKNATVVNCHTGTKDIPEITRQADILVAASGKLNMVDESYVNSDQIVIDVGVNWDEEKNSIAGDVNYDMVEPLVSAITPVPGGVGGVTTCLLISHVIEAALKR